MLRPFIAPIVNLMQTTQTETQANAETLAAHGEREVLSRHVETLTVEIRQIRQALKKD